jgi:hypothetical protein
MGLRDRRQARQGERHGVTTFRMRQKLVSIGHHRVATVKKALITPLRERFEVARLGLGGF